MAISKLVYHLGLLEIEAEQNSVASSKLVYLDISKLEYKDISKLVYWAFSKRDQNRAVWLLVSYTK